MIRELKLAARRLVQQRTFAVTAVATLAVGIGATTAIFSTVNATLLRPLPYPHAQDVYKVNTRFVDGRWTSGRMTSGYSTGIAESAPSVLGAVGVGNGDAVVLADDGRNVQVLLHAVSEGFFALLGVPGESLRHWWWAIVLAVGLTAVGVVAVRRRNERRWAAWRAEAAQDIELDGPISRAPSGVAVP